MARPRLLVIFALAACSGPSAELPGDSGPPGDVEPLPHPLAFAGEAVSAPTPLPPLSGGTLAIVTPPVVDPMGVQAWIIASIPEADRVEVIPLCTTGVCGSGAIALDPGSEPGRVVGDGSGRAHVALRGTGDVLTITPENLTSRHVCDAPRGLAYDAAIDSIHVACATGEIVTLPASGGPPTRRVFVDRDLRDVVVVPREPGVEPFHGSPSALLVSRFRAAEILRIDGSGRLVARTQLPSSPKRSRTAHVAWRMTAIPSGGLAVSYLLDRVAPVDLTAAAVAQTGGSAYGGSSVPVADLEARDGPIVQPVVAMVSRDGTIATPLLVHGGSPSTDVAIALDGTTAVAAGDEVFVFGGVMTQPQEVISSFRQATAVAFVTLKQTSGTVTWLVAQWRANKIGGGGGEITISAPHDVSPQRFFQEKAAIPLAGAADTGFDLFHTPTSAGIACASCHPEGGDDGHVWSFKMEDGSVRQRRTQSLRGGILATAPFHWDGDMPGMHDIGDEVFSKRMGGDRIGPSQLPILERFIDAIPRLPPPANLDAARAERGRTVFEGRGRCTDCHSGPKLTNNATLDVGTGAVLQVPQLMNIGNRAPFLHDGCAKTLADRFDPGCGGDRHGARDLGDAEKLDLIEYLESL